MTSFLEFRLFNVLELMFRPFNVLELKFRLFDGKVYINANFQCNRI